AEPHRAGHRRRELLLVQHVVHAVHQVLPVDGDFGDQGIPAAARPHRAAGSALMASPPQLSQRTGVVGVFGTLDGAVLALKELKSKGYANLTTYSPTPQHELEEVLDEGIS